MRNINDLRDYQVKAIDWITEKPYAGIFMDMGLGKTASALTAVQKLFAAEENGPVLVVGPIRVIETVWRQEALLWDQTSTITFSLIRGRTPQQRLQALQSQADIYLINPESFIWLLELFTIYPPSPQRPFPFSTLIIDESSTFKNVGSKRFQKLRHKLKLWKRRYILTGTPRPNKLLELWPQVFILDQGERLGTSYTKFKEKYFEPIDYMGYIWEPKKGAEKKIYALVEDLLLRIESDEIPVPIYNRVIVKLPPNARKLYRQMERDAFAEIEGTQITAANAAVALGKCRQIANGVVYAEGSVQLIHQEKLIVAREIVEGTGSPIIIVYNYKHELKLLTEELKEFKPVVLSESLDTIRTVDDWNAGRIQVLLLHPASGGHGLNLQQGGHTMAWFSLTFSYEQYIQTISRINRQGQQNKVIIHVIIADHTVDELLEEVLQNKEVGQNKLFTALKHYGDKRDLGL